MSGVSVRFLAGFLVDVSHQGGETAADLPDCVCELDGTGLREKSESSRQLNLRLQLERGAECILEEVIPLLRRSPAIPFREFEGIETAARRSC